MSFSRRSEPRPDRNQTPTPGLFSILVILLAGLIVLIQFRILRYAYMRLGVGPGAALLLLFGSLIGSHIPITILPGPPVRTGVARVATHLDSP
jgi:uncharacterized membrane protein